MLTKLLLRRTVALFAVGALALTAVACGSDDDDATTTTTSATDAASEQVCDARTDIGDSLDTAIDEFSNGNLGNAVEALSQVGSGLGSLSDAVSNLSDAQREEIEPQIQQLREDITSLSAGELSSGIEQVRTDVDDMLDEIASDYDCD